MTPSKLGIALFTLIEDITLVAWLALVKAGRQVLGIATLPVGLFFEHVVATNVKNGQSVVNVTGVPFSRIAVNAVVETVVWTIWLLLWALNPVVASMWLYLTLVIEHNLTDNIFHGRPLFSDLFNERVFVFSGIEWLGSITWLILVTSGLIPAGIVVLVVAQYFEHKMAIDVGIKP